MRLNLVELGLRQLLSRAMQSVPGQFRLGAAFEYPTTRGNQLRQWLDD